MRSSRDTGRMHLIDVRSGNIQSKRAGRGSREPAIDLLIAGALRLKCVDQLRADLVAAGDNDGPNATSKLLGRRTELFVHGSNGRAVQPRPPCRASPRVRRPRPYRPDSTIRIGTQSATCTASTRPGASDTIASASGRAADSRASIASFRRTRTPRPCTCRSLMRRPTSPPTDLAAETQPSSRALVPRSTDAGTSPRARNSSCLVVNRCCATDSSGRHRSASPQGSMLQRNAGSGVGSVHRMAIAAAATPVVWASSQGSSRPEFRATPLWHRP